MKIRPQQVIMLDRVNAVRRACGVPELKELPKGTRRDPHNCVIANALKDIAPGISVSSTHITAEEVDERFWRQIEYSFGLDDDGAFDGKTERFIRSFDRGSWPHLVDPDRPQLVTTVP